MEVELDDRLSDESKNYVTNFFKLSKPEDVIYADLKMVRKLRDDASRAINNSINIENLEITEFQIKNKNDNHDIAITKYVPKNLKENPSITVFFHGGGFCLGSRLTHHHSVCLLASKTNSIWLSVEYRRCPDECKYPTPFDDCKTVVEWAIQNKTTLGTANSKLGVCGDSAGGQMALIIAHELRSNIDFQVLIYPCVKFSNEYESHRIFTKNCFMLVPKVIEFFTKNLSDNPFDHADHLSPISYKDFSNLPKCLIIAVELDPMVDHSTNYFEKLKENSIECNLNIIKGTIHGYFSLPTMFPSAFKQTQDWIAEFYDKF